MKTVFLIQCVLMEVKLDNEILDDLLYISRLNVDEKQKPALMEEIKKSVSGLDVLRKYVDESELQRHGISEAALRGNEIVKQLDTQDLKKKLRRIFGRLFSSAESFGIRTHYECNYQNEFTRIACGT